MSRRTQRMCDNLKSWYDDSQKAETSKNLFFLSSSLGSETHRRDVVWFTSTSRKSWSFLHVAEKVSEVPNSKYHSLFFVLKETRQQELQRDREKRKRWQCFPPTSKCAACTVAVFSSLSAASYTTKTSSAKSCTAVCFKGAFKLHRKYTSNVYRWPKSHSH